MFLAAGFFDSLRNMDFLDQIANILRTLLNPSDLLDVFSVSLIIYIIMRAVRGTRAVQLVKGFILVALVYLVVQILNLRTMGFLLSKTLDIGLIAMVIVFQPELRRGLEQMGRLRIPLISSGSRDVDAKRVSQMIGAVVQASIDMSKTKTGALMVIERVTKLGEIIRTGTVVDGQISAELVENIFYPKSPLHDGAMIIRSDRIYAAGCYLPLSSSMSIGRELGTRHRSAVGMSENSDALIVVVSEETGDITIAESGVLYRKLSPAVLQKMLEERLLPERKEGGERRFFHKHDRSKKGE